MIAIINLIVNIVNIFLLFLFIQIVLHWLIYFGKANPRNRLVYAFNDIAYKITEPVLKPFRRLQARHWPSMQADLSPIALMLALYFFVDVLYLLVH